MHWTACTYPLAAFERAYLPILSLADSVSWRPLCEFHSVSKYLFMCVVCTNGAYKQQMKHDSWLSLGAMSDYSQTRKHWTTCLSQLLSSHSTACWAAHCRQTTSLFWLTRDKNFQMHVCTALFGWWVVCQKVLSLGDLLLWLCVFVCSFVCTVDVS